MESMARSKSMAASQLKPSVPTSQRILETSSRAAQEPLLVNAGGIIPKKLPAEERSLENLLNRRGRDELYKAWSTGRRYLMSQKVTSDEKELLELEDDQITSEDVLRAASLIEHRLRGTTTYTVVGRIRPFVGALQAYGQALSVYANASSTVMSPLWGTTLVALLIASNLVESFDKLLDMLQDISENLPRFEQYASRFKGHAMFSAAISLLYYDIGTFFVETIEFFSKRGIAILWKSLWTPFESGIGQIIAQLRKHILLVDNEAHSASLQQQQDMQDMTFDALDCFVSETIRYQREASDAQRLQCEILDSLQHREVTKWLSSYMPQMDYDDAEKKLHPSTGAWLLDLYTFHAWLTALKNEVFPILWVHGAPGCGKTILAAKIIQFISKLMEEQKQDDEKTVLGYFFCDYKDAAKNSQLAVARSLVGQFLAANTNLFPHVVTAMKQSGSPEANSAVRLFSLAADLLSSFSNSFLVVDGIDECSVAERRRILSSLCELVTSSKTAKVIILSRNEPDIAAALASFPSYAINSKDTTPDIQKYLADALQYTQPFKFNLKLSMRSEFERKASSSASGNFLWVRLMIDTIKSQPLDDYKQVKDVVTNVPLGLASAYGRVLARLLYKTKSIQDLILIILRLMIASYKPLNFGVLRHALSQLDATNSLALTEAQNLKTLLEETCAPLIDFHADTTFNFTHQTVSEFLTSSAELWTNECEPVLRYRIDPREAHETMALCCLKCMSSAAFTVDGNTVSFDGLMPPFFAYAATNWIHHVSTSESRSSTLAIAITEFLNSGAATRWLKWRLQSPGRVQPTIGDLLVEEQKLLRWAAVAHDSQRTTQNVTNFVQNLYEQWHASLCSELDSADASCLESSITLVEILMLRGEYQLAEKTSREVLSMATTMLGRKHTTTLDCLDSLANSIARQGHWEETVEILRECLLSRMEHGDHLNLKMFSTSDQLGAALTKSVGVHRGPAVQAQLEEARLYHTRALEGRVRANMGEDHPDFLTGLHFLARLQIRMELYDEAEKTLLRHQELAIKVHGVEHRNYQHAMDDLGSLYQETAQHAKAEAIYETVLMERKKIHGDQHPNVNDSIWSIGVLQQEQGRYEAAIANFESLEALNVKSYGKTHRYTLKPYARIGEIYVKLAKDSMALPYLETVISHCDRQNRNSVELTNHAAGILDGIYERSGRKRKVEALRARS